MSLPDADDDSTDGRALNRRRFLAMGVAASAIGLVRLPGVANAQTTGISTLSSSSFDVGIDRATGGIFRLRNPQDSLATNYVINPDIRPNFNVDDSRWIGDLVLNVRVGNATAGVPMVTSLSDDIRTVAATGTRATVTYSGNASNQYGLHGVSLVETYNLTGNQLSWTMTLTNKSTQSMEFLDIGFPMLMNSYWNSGSQTGIYEQNVGRHSFVGKDGSYLYWQRPNGVGPFLVMVPQAGTSLEFKNKARYGEGPFGEVDPVWEGVVEYYIHAKNVAVARAGQAAAYLPTTSLTLAPGAQKTYGFTFAWAADAADLRSVVYTLGGVDVVSLPGMVIPRGSTATLAVRANSGITGVTGEAGKSVTVTAAGTKQGYSIYTLAFPTGGANMVTIAYGSGRQAVLQYLSVGAIESTVAARATFITTKQQAKTTRGYDGAYLQWSMATKKLITWDDYPGGGWKQWMAGGSDDLGLSPAVFVSEKNTFLPNQSEITSVDYYLEHFIQNYLQGRRENGQVTFQVYRWYDGQDGTPADQGVWRAYNYVHVANAHFNMYRIGRLFPRMTLRLPVVDYLNRCYLTLVALFTKIPADNPLGDAAHNFGLMGESTYPDILAALRAENMTAQADNLANLLAPKRDKLFSEAYPFASEASIDTTGFESCYTFAKMYGNTALADKVTRASLACRGSQPLWYYYGSDNRHMGESWWNLSYESQLGAWQQQDYAYFYVDPSNTVFDEIMRSTAGAYLAGWGTVNTGHIDPDPANQGASAWLYQSEKGATNYDWIPNLNGWWSWSGESDLGYWGGLRTAAVNVVNDRIVGLYAYHGTVSLASGKYTITPRDGVRTRFGIYITPKLAVQLDGARYTQATVTTDRTVVTITLDNVSGGAYAPRITLCGLPAGTYRLTAGTAVTFTSDGKRAVVTAPTLTGTGTVATISRVS